MHNIHDDEDLSRAWRCHFDRREGIQRILEATFADVGPLVLQSVHGWVETLATTSDQSFARHLRDAVADSEEAE